MEKCIWSLGKAQHCTTVRPTAAGVLLQDAVSKLALLQGGGAFAQAGPTGQSLWVGLIFIALFHYYFVLCYTS